MRSEAPALAGAFSITISLFNQLHAEEFAGAAKAVGGGGPDAATTDEDFWSVIQRGLFGESGDPINLNNGGVSIADRGAAGGGAIQRALQRGAVVLHVGNPRSGARAAAGAAWRTWSAHKPGEIAIDRNSTEALNTIIYGLPLKAGDEVIGCKAGLSPA